MKTTLKFLSIVFLIFISSSLYAQGNIDLTNTMPDNQSGWLVYQQNDNVAIYYKYTKCEIFEFAQLKIQNLTSHPINLSWVYVYQLDGQTLDSNPDDTHVQLMVPANASIESNCAKNVPELTTFIAEADGVKRMTTIALTELEITIEN